MRLLIINFFLTAIAMAQTSAPVRPTGIDEALWQRVVEVNHKSEKIADLTADFEQQKVTAMLRKPLFSSGKVLVRGPVMRWDTATPEPTIMRIDPREVQIFYPHEKTVEVYRLGDKLASLAESPVPRLDVLIKYFDFAKCDLGAFGVSDDAKYLALQLTPLHGTELEKYIKQIRVLITTTTGQLDRMAMIDSDEDQTTIAFSHVRINVGLTEKDVALDVPGDVKIVHPLAGMEPERRQ